MSRRAIEVQANGLKLAGFCWGPEDAAETFVICHGFLDQAATFQWVAEPIAAAGHRVIALDWRGHGASDRIGAGGYYHFPDYVLDLDVALPQLVEGSVHLVGHSMGGTACCLFAGLRSERLQTLTLVEGVGPLAHEAEGTRDKYLTWLKSMEGYRARDPKPLASVEDAASRLRRTHGSRLTEERALDIAKLSTVEREGQLFWAWDPMHRTTSPMPFLPSMFDGFLSSIDVPTLVIVASNGFRPPDEAERIAKIEGARTIEVPDAGHMLHWEKPEELARLLITRLP